MYRLASSGPFFDFVYLDKFAKCIQTSLTPGQVLDTVQDVIKDFRASYDDFKEQYAMFIADSGEGARKKRRKDSPTKSTHADLEIIAVSFALLSRTAAVIFPALPMHLLLNDAQETIRAVVSEAYSTVVINALQNSVDAIGKYDRNSIWAAQLVTASALHFHYALTTARNLRLQLEDNDIGVSLQAMLTACASEDTVPELAVEIVCPKSSCFVTAQ